MNKSPILENSNNYILQSSDSMPWFFEAMNFVNDSMIMVDRSHPEEGILFANNSFCTLTGYDKQDVLGKNCRFLQGSQTNKDTVDAIRHCLKERKPFKGVILNYKKDGTPFWNDLFISPLETEKKQSTFFIGKQNDITKKKTTVNIEDEKGYDFLSFLNNINAGVVVHAPDSSILFTNEKAASLLGIKKQESLHLKADNPYWEFVHENGIPFKVSEYPVSVVLNTKKITENIVVGIKKHNPERTTWLLVNGYPEMEINGDIKHVLISFIDITSIKESEGKSKQERLQLKSIINNLPEAIYIKDKKGRKLVSNPYDLYYCGAKEESEVIGKTDVELFLGEAGKRGFETDMEIMRTGKPLINYEEDFILKNGEKIWLLSTKVPIFTDEGEINGLIGIGTNITDRKKIEEEQKRSYQLLNDQNNRLKNFSYIVSHNLRSHVSNIKTIANLLYTNPDKNETDELLKYLKTVVSSLDDTIVNLNTVVEIQNNLTIDLSIINLKKSVENVIGLMEMQAANKKVAISIHIPEDTTIRHYPAYLESILLNIISNTVKYSDPKKESYIQINSYIKDEYTVLEVNDNGLGIDMKRNGQKLFGMYKTFHSHTHPEAKGIGLFITKNQIESLGGKIEVESALGVGSIFRIFFK